MRQETENGFVYEIGRRYLHPGRKDGERTVPHSLTLDCARLFDRIYDSLRV